MFNEYKLRNFSFRLVAYVLALNTIGILVISSATNKDMALIGRQITGIGVGIIIMTALALLPYERIMGISALIYAGCISILTLVLFFGENGKGAKRWLIIPGIGQLQPSEFVKIGLIIFFAWFLAKYREHINDIRILGIFGLIAGIPYALVLAEPDLSTTIVLIICGVSMLYVAGLSYKWIGGALAVLLPAAGAFIYLLRYEMIPFLRGYQARRILAWVNPAKYADANMQQDNSIMAIGSGQLFGKGLNNNTLASVKNGNFLSEEQTDFVFAVIGEELGFAGCAAVIILFALIVFECIYIAGKAKDLQGRLICVGFAAIIAFQSFTNIAVATGIFPNTGLTLPFISYGVSSLLSLYFGIGIVLNIGLQRNKRMT